jgi:hypothetical protein
MFKLIKLTKYSKFGVEFFQVILDKEYTVKELLDIVLTIKDEWGTFSITGFSYCEYKYGKLLTNLDEEDLNKKVINVSASGGLSRMDYYIKVD